MIYDRLDKLATYKGISKNLDTAIDYLGKNKVGGMPEGKHPVDGDRVIVQVMSYETKDLSAAKFEIHKKYIDIQIVLEGKEGCYCRPMEGLEPSEPFITERDVGFLKGEGGAFMPLTPEVFAIFFPHDAHKPSCDWEGKHKNRKVVVKIAV
jgi:YhcH/YjgK/YiaL family protein